MVTGQIYGNFAVFEGWTARGRKAEGEHLGERDGSYVGKDVCVWVYMYVHHLHFLLNLRIYYTYLLLHINTRYLPSICLPSPPPTHTHIPPNTPPSLIFSRAAQ